MYKIPKYKRKKELHEKTKNSHILMIVVLSVEFWPAFKKMYTAYFIMVTEGSSTNLNFTLPCINNSIMFSIIQISIM